jgi:lipoprotein NlpD
VLIHEQLRRNIIVGALTALILLCTGCGSHLYHQVRPDDTLYSISWRYNHDYRQVAQWNDIKPPYVIHQGDWLRVAPPRGEATVRSLSSASPVTKAAPTGPVTAAAVPESQQPEKRELVSRAEVAWLWPTKGQVVEKFRADSSANQGIDISAPLGTPVHAAAAGKVVYSGNGLRGYGNLIIIKHNDKYLSAYGHNQQLLVKEGAQVNQGEMIARVGNTETERVQLHFQIRIDGKPVDPLRYLP